MVSYDNFVDDVEAIMEALEFTFAFWFFVTVICYSFDGYVSGS